MTDEKTKYRIEYCKKEEISTSRTMEVYAKDFNQAVHIANAGMCTFERIKEITEWYI